MTRIIGITGGIGSGKSTLTACFSKKGYPVIDADAIARTALTPQSACFSEAIALFGEKALNPDGTANRHDIASCVFADETLRTALDDIIHPFVISQMLKQTEECGAPLAVWDVPLLFESGCDAYCACTVAVLCDTDIRVARVMERDRTDEASVRARIDAQMTDEERAALATYTIRNNGTLEAFSEEADALISEIGKELL